MKKVIVGLVIGWVAGIAATIIGLRVYYLNDVSTDLVARKAIPDILQMVLFALKGSAYIFMCVFITGLLIVIIGWIMEQRAIKRRH
jgi:hypothetical protein